MLKTGQKINFKSIAYLFLGYVDYKRKWGVIADRFGNKTTIYCNDLK